MPPTSPSISQRVTALAPGLGFCAALSLGAYGLQRLEELWLPHAIVEALVLALLLGIAVRNGRPGGFSVENRPSLRPGIDFCAKPLLELAVCLLGATMDLRQLLAGGPRLLLSVALAVTIALAGSALLGRRLFKLGERASTLVAVGNAICGNSAIAVIAPLIGASASEVAGAIAFTAVFGVAVVLLLPLLIPLLHLSHGEYGVLAGLSVYAVPQVLAASFPVSLAAGEKATLVKLIRVLMLGPLAIYFALRHRRSAAGAGSKPPTLKLKAILPWFIVGFLLLSLLRFFGVVPAVVVPPLRAISKALTVAAMVALGLGVELRALRKASLATTGTVIGSLLLLLVVSVILIRLFALG